MSIQQSEPIKSTNDILYYAGRLPSDEKSGIRNDDIAKQEIANMHNYLDEKFPNVTYCGPLIIDPHHTVTINKNGSITKTPYMKGYSSKIITELITEPYTTIQTQKTGYKETIKKSLP